MAISVGRSLKQLEAESEKLNLIIEPSGKNGRFMKEDYIWPIRNHFINERYGSIEQAPNHLKWMLELKSPMLARRIDDGIPEDIITAVWESDNWYLEEKLNGARMLIVKDSSGLNVYSRHNSDVDLLPINYTNKILFNDNFDEDLLKDDFILDTEITSDITNLSTVIEGYGVVTETMLQAVTALLSSDVDRAVSIQRNENLRLTFNLFDCIYYGNQFLFNEPLAKRRKLGFEILEKLMNAGFRIVPVRANRSSKKAFHKTIISEGGEGTIAKRIDGIYIPDTNRPKDGWLKIKRSISSSMGEGGDTVDGWISGFEPATEGKNREGLIGNILVSVYVKGYDGNVEEHCIAKISGIDMQLRQDMTEVVGGVPTLKPSFYNRVVEIDGAGISARSRRFNHAVFLGFRNEKNKDDCVLEESFIDSMLL